MLRSGLILFLFSFLLFDLRASLRGICFPNKQAHHLSCHSAHTPNLFGRVDISKSTATAKIKIEKFIKIQKLSTAPLSTLGISNYLEITLSAGVIQKSFINTLVNHAIFMVTSTALTDLPVK